VSSSTLAPWRFATSSTVKPSESRSRVTIALDFEAHGIGKLLVPLIVRRQARAEMPKNQQGLKELLERGA
jgi:hypothetical protein